MITHKPDILKKQDATKLFDTVMDMKFAWHYFNGVNYLNDGYSQFYHMFYFNNQTLSPYLEEVRPLINCLDPLAIIKIKANLLPKTETIVEHPFHQDYEDQRDYKTAIYYVNSNNGYTRFKEDIKVQSEANKLILFDGPTDHASATCTDIDRRVVININYFAK